MKRGIEYILDPSKTSSEYVGGIGVNAENAVSRMDAVKGVYHKTGGRQYIHFVASFRDKVSKDEAFEIAGELAQHYSSFQVLYAVHFNTYNTHIHFIINTVCVMDGHKFNQSQRDMLDVKNHFLLLCHQRGIDYDIEDLEYDGCDDDSFLYPDNDYDDYERIYNHEQYYCEERSCYLFPYIDPIFEENPYLPLYYRDYGDGVYRPVFADTDADHLDVILDFNDQTDLWPGIFKIDVETGEVIVPAFIKQDDTDGQA